MPRKKRRWKRTLLWGVAIMLVVGFSSLLTMNYVINKLMDEMVIGLEQQIETEIEAQLLSQPKTDPGNVAQPTVSEDNTQSVAHTHNPISPQVPVQGSISAVAPTPNMSLPISSSNSQNINSMSSQPTDSNKSDDNTAYSPEISLSKVETIKNRVTISEKAAISEILINKLGISEIKLFQEMASGGLSVEEKREARKVLLEKLSPEEYDRLIEIAKKYGLSQGKTYTEVTQSHK